MLSPFIRKLEQFSPLSEAEKQAIQSAPLRLWQVASHQDIVSDRARPAEVHLIANGFACRYKVLHDGRRQITAFLMAGDFCDLRGLLLHQMDFGIAALGPSTTLAVISHERLMGILEKHPRLAFGLWRDAMIDAAICRQWLINIGRRSAYARIAHLLCEIWHRMQAVGLARDGSFELPMTQAEIGDALGLSTVHVNRTLQQLRADRLIEFKSNVVTVLDWQRLQAAGEFDPGYLQLAPDLKISSAGGDVPRPDVRFWTGN
jgi:CRP-like cAMP-binding protein